jgi:hypothetical protein
MSRNMNYFYSNTPLLAAGIKGMRINLGRISLLDPAFCGGDNIPRQLAAGSAAATLIHTK